MMKSRTYSIIVHFHKIHLQLYSLYQWNDSMCMFFIDEGIWLKSPEKAGIILSKQYIPFPQTT